MVKRLIASAVLGLASSSPLALPASVAGTDSTAVLRVPGGDARISTSPTDRRADGSISFFVDDTSRDDGWCAYLFEKVYFEDAPSPGWRPVVSVCDGSEAEFSVEHRFANEMEKMTFVLVVGSHGDYETVSPRSTAAPTALPFLLVR